MLTACGGGTSSSEQTSAPTTSATTTTASEATSASTEKTTAATTTADTSAEESKPETVEEETIETPVEHEPIVPIEIEPQSIPEEDINDGLSELAVITTLLCSNGEPMDYYAITIIFEKGSPLDAPLPNSAFITDWGCYPTVIADAINSDILSAKFNATAFNNVPIEEVYKQIDNGTPAAVWVTEKLFTGDTIIEAEGIKLNVLHEVVILVGYSDTQVMVWSPFQDDYVIYDKVMFEQCFEQEGSYALTITNK